MLVTDYCTINYYKLSNLKHHTFKTIFIVLFVYGCAGPSLLQGNKGQVQGARVTLKLQCVGFSLQQLLLLQSMGSRARGLQQLLHVGSVIVAPKLQSPGLAAQPHMGSSRTQDRSRVSCIGRLIFFTTEPPGKPPSHIFGFTVSAGQESESGLAGSSLQSLSQDCNKGVSQAQVSSKGSAAKGSTFKFLWLLVEFSSLRSIGLRTSFPYWLLATGYL